MSEPASSFLSPQGSNNFGCYEFAPHPLFSMLCSRSSKQQHSTCLERSKKMPYGASNPLASGFLDDKVNNLCRTVLVNHKAMLFKLPAVFVFSFFPANRKAYLRSDSVLIIHILKRLGDVHYITKKEI